jgi:hypothetical protein
MSKKKILVQLDPDSHPSVFDSVVAIDSGVDHLLSHGNVAEDDVTGLVHGAIFTRSMNSLKSTALFFGGSNVSRTESLVRKAKGAFFGPMRVSLMSDPNGCNTTAAAAVLSAGQHLSWNGATVTVLAATGPVGIRIAQIIASEVTQEGGSVDIRVCSRKLDRAKEVIANFLLESESSAKVNFIPLEVSQADQALSAVDGCDAVFAAGAAGIELLPEGWHSGSAPKVAVDVNAVPPAGINSIDVMDNGKISGATICYGAIGVGGLKMKIHRKCIESLFESNDRVLEVHEIHTIGKTVLGS